MPRTPRRRIAKGVYVDRYSLTGKVQVGTHQREKAFPRQTSTREIQQWIVDERAKLLKDHPRIAKGTIDADSETYLERMEKRPISLPAKRSEMKAWRAAVCADGKRIGGKARHLIVGADIDHTIADWVAAGVAPKTILNRCRTFHHFYVTLADDRKARTPLDNVDVPKPNKRRPKSVAPATIRAVEKRLRRGDPKTRARFMVMASTGIRPAQLRRLTKGDVDLKRRLVLVDGAKGGDPIVHWLNDDMRAAWALFVEADAFGAFDSSAFALEVRSAGWPEGIRVYNAKHSVGMELAERGADNDDIRAWFGHTDSKTTRIYTGVPLARMRRVSEQLAGRLGWAPLAPRVAPRPTVGARRKPAETFGKSKGKKSA